MANHMRNRRSWLLLAFGIVTGLAVAHLRETTMQAAPPGRSAPPGTPPPQPLPAQTAPLSAEPASPDRFVQRAENTFGTVYLTLISIVQGVALGFLAQATAGSYDTLGIDRIGRTVGAILIIIAVWQEYMVKATAFSWVPTILDTIFPFLLGVGEFLLAAAILKPLAHYLLLVCVFYGVGAFACLNYYVQAGRSTSQVSRDSRLVISVHYRTQYKIAAGGFVYALSLWVIIASSHATGWHGLIAWLSTLPAIAFAVSIIPRWNRPINQAQAQAETNASHRV